MATVVATLSAMAHLATESLVRLEFIHEMQWFSRPLGPRSDAGTAAGQYPVNQTLLAFVDGMADMPGGIVTRRRTDGLPKEFQAVNTPLP